ncbi:MAG: YceD family protein [Gammaproteobacteria bacterium]|nr:YceD family protein [Gammaproteobacteria bacterium]
MTLFDTDMVGDYHARPMPDSLQVQLNPIKLAARGERLSGTLQLKQLERLCRLLESDQGEVVGEVEFGTDLQGIKYLEGRAEVTLSLRCERCLQAMEWPLEAEFKLGMVVSETRELPESYEPLMLPPDEGLLSLGPVIEDELLLHMPMIAMHPEGECDPAVVDELRVLKSPGRENPFAVLDQIKPSE